MDSLPNSEQLVWIPAEQARFHRFWEAASVFVQLPFMVYLGTRRELPAWARAGAWALAGLILYVDGGLLLEWQQRQQRQQRQHEEG